MDRRTAHTRRLFALVLTACALVASPAGAAFPPETSPTSCEMSLTGLRVGDVLNAEIATTCTLPVQTLSIGPLIAYGGAAEFARRPGIDCTLCAEISLRTTFPCTGACFGDWQLSGRHFIEGAIWVKDLAGTGIEISTVDTEPGFVNCGPVDGPNITNIRRTLTVACSTFTIGS